MVLSHCDADSYVNARFLIAAVLHHEAIIPSGFTLLPVWYRCFQETYANTSHACICAYASLGFPGMCIIYINHGSSVHYWPIQSLCTFVVCIVLTFSHALLSVSLASVKYTFLTLMEALFFFTYELISPILKWPRVSLTVCKNLTYVVRVCAILQLIINWFTWNCGIL